MGKTVAVIMAGGRGERMDLLCHVRPKPTLPFARRFSVIDFTLSNCLYSGIRNLVVLIDYQCSHTERYLWILGSVKCYKGIPPSIGMVLSDQLRQAD